MSSTYVTEDVAVLAMHDFIADELTDRYIYDPSVRMEVAKMLLYSGKFVDISGEKYDLSNIATGEGFVKAKDPYQMKRITVHVSAGLTASQKSKLIANNPDVSLTFTDTTVMAHSYAYAQRVIDTTKCLSLVNQREELVLDIGGNYATHSMRSNRNNVHCCTLLDSAVEAHRQTQRSVLLDLAEVNAVSYCMGGAENCKVQAKNAISLHTLPNIDPDLLPKIFENHGIELMEGVHHYDCDIERFDVGYIPELEMNWRTEGFHEIEFFFENDSSYSYKHRRDWLLEYAHNWVREIPGGQQLVRYQVDYIMAGVLKWTAIRMDINTLGRQEIRQQFRYYNNEDIVEVMLPRFQPGLGKAITDPKAYTVENVVVPAPMFSHLYKFGVSNDTDRPDLALSFESMKMEANSYNHLKKVNGTSMTINHKLSTEHIGDVALAMYLLVVKKAAMNRVVQSKFTSQMLNVQKRWGADNLLHLTTRAFTNAAILPFLYLAETFVDKLDLIAMQMRVSLADDMVVAAAQDVLPYKILPEVVPINGSATHYVQKARMQIPVSGQVSESVPVQQFFELFKDVMNEDTRTAYIKYLDGKSSGGIVGSDQSDSSEDKPVSESDLGGEKYSSAVSTLPDTPLDLESWQTATDMFNERFPIMPREQGRIGLPSDIMAPFSTAMYEYGLNSVDVALCALSEARDAIRHTWTGDAPKGDEVAQINTIRELGIKYFQEDNGVVRDMDVYDKYDIALDPVTFKVLELIRKGDQVLINPKSAFGFIYVDEKFRIFNYFKLAKTAIYEAKQFYYRDVSLTLVNGVPGCGKTYEIVNTFSITDVIVCAVRASKDDTLARLKRMDKFKGFSKELESRVRTLDSGNMHSLPTANKMFVDEGLLASPGAVFTAIVRAKTKNVFVFGDEAQIGYIDRGSKIGVLRHEKINVWTYMEQRNVSYRISAEAMWLYKQTLPIERQPLVKVASPILRNVDYLYEPNMNSGYYNEAVPGMVYITVLRDDRGSLVRRPGFANGKKLEEQYTDLADSRDRPVYSVHEAQGKDEPAITVVRLNPTTVGTFESVQHRNVGLTRHTLRCKVVSPVPLQQDPWGKLIHLVKTTVTNDELQEMVSTDVPEAITERFEKLIQKYPQF